MHSFSKAYTLHRPIQCVVDLHQHQVDEEYKLLKRNASIRRINNTKLSQHQITVIIQKQTDVFLRGLQIEVKVLINIGRSAFKTFHIPSLDTSASQPPEKHRNVNVIY